MIAPRRTFALALLASAALTPAAAQQAPKPVPGLDRIKHIVVIYLENRSFDNLYGSFPGANGLANAGDAARQVDRDGKHFEKLPPVLNTMAPRPDPKGPAAVDARFPTDLPNGPFAMDKIAGYDQTTGDAVHKFYQEQNQIDGGKMDKFVAWSDASSMVMGHYDGSRMPMWAYAQKYVLADNFFHAAFGGSFLNHFWLVCACTPVFPDAPLDMRATVDDAGRMKTDGSVTPDGYAVNTIFPLDGPFHPLFHDPKKLLPMQTLPNIGDRLSAKNISWAWYSGGWNDAVAGKGDPDFQYHHQVFAYFKNTALGTTGAKAHLKDEADFIADIQKGRLPAVAFFKPIGEENEHPGYTSVASGEHHTREIVRMIERSPLWRDTVVIVTYDENGGLWDHVAPPKIDKWGPGARIPTLVISPYAKKGFVDHTQYDTTSILKLIETRFGLAPLSSRDAATADMTNALDLKSPGTPPR